MSGSAIHEIESLIHQGRFAEACQRCEQQVGSGELRIQQLYALALSKSGSPKTARDILEPYYLKDSHNPETAGILGGIYKAIFSKEQNTTLALKSRDTYLANFTATGDYYTGINAATMSAVAGQAGKGREIAASLISKLPGDTENFWEVATLAEAHLLTKSREKAMQYYLKARKLCGTDWGKVGSVYNQLWLLNHYLPVPQEVLKTFSPPTVLAFTGHMMDGYGREQPRFPDYMESQIKLAIAGAIRSLQGNIGYCSLACGSDILFAEALEEAGGEVNVWLPFDRSDFIKTSVAFGGQSWVDRFERLSTKHPVTFLTEEPYGKNDDLFPFLSQVIFGSAVLRAAMNFNKPTLLTVQSESDLKRKEGGTRDAASRWPYADRRFNINTDNFLKPTTPINASPSVPFTPEPIKDRPVLYALVADFTDDEPRDTTWKTVMEAFTSGITYATLDQDDFLIVTFSTIRGSLEMLENIRKVHMKALEAGKLRLSLYASPLFIDAQSKKLVPKSRERLLSFHKTLSPGNVYALARYASVLSLEGDRYTLDFTGVISPPGERTTYDIFVVSSSALA